MAIVENDPSARMQVRSRGDLRHPGACMVCGSGTCDDGYLDLGVFYDYEGTQYLCMTCITQAAETVGMYTPDQVKHSHDLANSLLEENEKLKAELENARPVLAGLERLFGAVSTASSLVDNPVSEEPAVEFDYIPDFTESADVRESVIEEPVASAGRSDSRGSKSRNIVIE